TTLACALPDGFAPAPDDCDDTEPLAWTGAAEACDRVDNDCDGTLDEGFLGSSAACPAATCLEILDQEGSPSGSYWLDPAEDGGASAYACDMTTDGGGWTQLIDWDRASGDPIDDLYDAFPLVKDDMGSVSDGGTYLQWCDYDSSEDVRAYRRELEVPNAGELMTTLHLDAVSMEGSGTFLFAEGSEQHNLLCGDDVNTIFTPAELSWLPDDDCPNQNATNYSWDGTFLFAFGEPLDSLHLRSFMADTQCKDYTRLYTLKVWVR
ncbi:MAG: hypothetical protein JXX28_12230, partial [Deltaproteobacteria bacterium]|nr:hypothetical protein [Deltaproteobacteria bacterium]